MKLSVNEAIKLIHLWARNCAAIQQVLILKFARKVTGPYRAFRGTDLWIITWLGGKEFPKLVLHTIGGPVWLESSAVPKIWLRLKEQLRRSKLNCHSSVILNKFSRDEGVR